MHFCGAQVHTGSSNVANSVMLDTLDLHPVSFTHSAADLQWPELAHLICVNDPENRSICSQALVENPAFANWFYYHWVGIFMTNFHEEVPGIKDYWLRFECLHRGCPHVHGLAWLTDAPSIEQSVIPEASALQYKRGMCIKVSPQLI